MRPQPLRQGGGWLYRCALSPSFKSSYDFLTAARLSLICRTGERAVREVERVLNIVIPMAGRGSRFLGSPELVPKPLIEVEPGRPMISYVVEHLRPARPHRFIFVARAEHAERFQLAALLEQLAPDHELVLTDAVTGGPLETTLLAAPLLGPDDELLISYCDSYFTIDLDAVLRRWSEAESGVLIYPSDGPMEA